MQQRISRLDRFLRPLGERRIRTKGRQSRALVCHQQLPSGSHVPSPHRHVPLQNPKPLESADFLPSLLRRSGSFGVFVWGEEAFAQLSRTGSRPLAQAQCCGNLVSAWWSGSFHGAWTNCLGFLPAE